MIAAAPPKKSCQDDQSDVDRSYEKLHTSLRRCHKELLARLDSQDAILRPGLFCPSPNMQKIANKMASVGCNWRNHGLAVHIRACFYCNLGRSIDPARSCRQIQGSMLEELLTTSRDELILHGPRGNLAKRERLGRTRETSDGWDRQTRNVFQVSQNAE